MDILNKTQIVIDLIEANMLEVNYEMIAKVTGIPIGLYQRIFTYICDISLAAYTKKKVNVSSKDDSSRQKEYNRCCF